MKGFVLVVALLVLSSAAFAQMTDSHLVNITVNEATWVDVADGPVNILVTPTPLAPTATGSAPSLLSWGTNGAGPYRIEVTSSCTVTGANLVQDYDLLVRATGVVLDNGNAAGAGTLNGAQLALDGSTYDIVTGIAQASAHCDLTYTAIADVTDPTGAAEAEQHDVVYTILTP